MTADDLRNQLNTFFTDGWYRYNGKDYFIDYISPTDMYIGTDDGRTHDFSSVDELMSAPIFDGKSLNEISDQIKSI